MLKNNETEQNLRRHDETRVASPMEVQSKKSAFKKLTAGVLCVLLILGVIWFMRNHPAASARQPLAAGRSGPITVPVVGGTATQKDVPIYLDGLGTVHAFNTVTVRVRVDGQLQ